MLELDRQIFCYFNQTLANSFFDGLMPIITDLNSWIPILICLLFWLIFDGGGKYRVFALFLCLSVGLSDFISSQVIKNIVLRKRPCCEIVEARKLTGCLKSKSFPSSHAANSTTIAGMVFFEMGPKIGIPILAIALVVAFSRIYVGVHYPMDVMSGIIVGFLVALFMTRFKRFVLRKKNEGS
ncbi:MAG: phosphatase PAP2 family protein [Candidatus Riflebacteria bacterium]|nr:phosphatase PAP2 family protein [Candidatus Riflebacteria bacterium]